MSLIKNSSIVIAGIIISNLLAFLFHFYTARFLGPSDYGIFGSLFALLSLLSLPAGAISTTITKFTSTHNKDKDYGRIEFIRSKFQRKIIYYGIILFILLALSSPLIALYLKID